MTPRRTEAAPEPLEPLEPPVRGGAPDRVGDDPLADHLRERWSALLGVLDVHDDDHFFDLGGDSLLGVHLIAGLRELTGHTVPPEVVFASARFGGMVEAVSGWLATAPPAAPAKGMSG